MYLEQTLKNYKIYRFIFSFSLLFSFGIFVVLSDKSLNVETVSIPAIILVIYTLASFFSLFIERTSIIDFLLDITAISSFIFYDFDKLKFFSLLYLFALFFAGFLLPSLQAYLVAFIAFVLYVLMFVFLGTFKGLEAVFNIILNGVAFAAITTAGIKLKEKIKSQEAYIEILEKEKKENELYKRLYRMAAELAHEIKNPLTSIKAAADLLGEGVYSPKLTDMIKKESERLNQLLKDFLMLSKPRKSNPQYVNIGNLLKQLLTTYRTNNKEVELNIKKNYTIYIDEKEFISALSNLIKNAFEWAKSKVSITVDGTKDYIIIIIEDDGPGIPREDINKIFEPFYTKREGGTGLGLAIAKRVIVENQGYLFVDPNKKNGTRFIIQLPVNKEGRDEGINR
ncbi:MAG: HAMP domain-containing histidine kinase [Aquificae bacterium]|nr:HAMP domain-containing histidine kinase [Aquificota bacterium]